MMLLFLLLFCSVFWIILFRFRRRRIYKLASAILEAARNMPFIGVTHTFTGTTEGYRYAIMPLKTALSAIVRNYKIVSTSEFGPIPHIKSKLDIMMKAVDEFEVILEKRFTASNTK